METLSNFHGMDFHSLSRKELQALCKAHGIKANMSNVAMADALKELGDFEGSKVQLSEDCSESCLMENVEMTPAIGQRTSTRISSRRRMDVKEEEPVLSLPRRSCRGRKKETEQKEVANSLSICSDLQLKMKIEGTTNLSESENAQFPAQNLNEESTNTFVSENVGEISLDSGGRTSTRASTRRRRMGGKQEDLCLSLPRRSCRGRKKEMDESMDVADSSSICSVPLKMQSPIPQMLEKVCLTTSRRYNRRVQEDKKIQTTETEHKEMNSSPESGISYERTNYRQLEKLLHTGRKSTLRGWNQKIVVEENCSRDPNEGDAVAHAYSDKTVAEASITDDNTDFVVPFEVETTGITGDEKCGEDPSEEVNCSMHMASGNSVQVGETEITEEETLQPENLGTEDEKCSIVPVAHAYSDQTVADTSIIDDNADFVVTVGVEKTGITEDEKCGEDPSEEEVNSPMHMASWNSLQVGETEITEEETLQPENPGTEDEKCSIHPVEGIKSYLDMASGHFDQVAEIMITDNRDTLAPTNVSREILAIDKAFRQPETGAMEDEKCSIDPIEGVNTYLDRASNSSVQVGEIVITNDSAFGDDMCIINPTGRVDNSLDVASESFVQVGEMVITDDNDTVCPTKHSGEIPAIDETFQQLETGFTEDEKYLKDRTGVESSLDMTSNSKDHVGKVVVITENGYLESMESLAIGEISKKPEVEYIEDEKCIKDANVGVQMALEVGGALITNADASEFSATGETFKQPETDESIENEKSNEHPRERNESSLEMALADYDEQAVEQKISSRELENECNENASSLNLESSDYDYGKETVDSRDKDFRDQDNESLKMVSGYDIAKMNDDVVVVVEELNMGAGGFISKIPSEFPMVNETSLQPDTCDLERENMTNPTHILANGNVFEPRQIKDNAFSSKLLEGKENPSESLDENQQLKNKCNEGSDRKTMARSVGRTEEDKDNRERKESKDLTGKSLRKLRALLKETIKLKKERAPLKELLENC
ncbi:hypothetical protein AMTRI_Chr09g20370 [Amborella trichopoda]